MLPSVDTGEVKIEPLRDTRVTKVLRKLGMEHCCVTQWSFGQEGEEEHKLKYPRDIATNTDGQLIITDNGDETVKVFSSRRKFLFSFKPQTDNTNKKFTVVALATDLNSNIYVLVELEKPGTETCELEVQVHKKSGDLLNKFPVRREYWG